MNTNTRLECPLDWHWLANWPGGRPGNTGGDHGENKRKPDASSGLFAHDSAANVGTDKDSERRQREAITAFAKRAGFVLMGEFYDEAVSGADAIETRKGFSALLDRIDGNGVRTVIVEDASCFARELMAQELGITLLISRGVRLLTAAGDDLTASEDPTRKMMRGTSSSRSARRGA